jgi:hypothetical protein
VRPFNCQFALVSLEAAPIGGLRYRNEAHRHNRHPDPDHSAATMVPRRTRVCDLPRPVSNLLKDRCATPISELRWHHPCIDPKTYQRARRVQELGG